MYIYWNKELTSFVRMEVEELESDDGVLLLFQFSYEIVSHPLYWKRLVQPRAGNYYLALNQASKILVLNPIELG